MENTDREGRPRVVVYAGPTLSPAEITAIVPDARVRPPAGRGDLLAQQWAPGDVAVLLDGYFRERRSVGHKEILWLLRRGVTVVGAASMGALRAAEMAPCGVVGMGTVFQMYVSGAIDGDDEVGVLHGPAERGYPMETVALVNLRFAVGEGARTGLVPPASGERIVAAAAALPFLFRTWADLAETTPVADHPVLRTLAARIDSGEWDLKRRDATAALRRVADGDVAPLARPEPSEVTFTGISADLLVDRATRREYAPGRHYSDLDVLDAARLYDPDYPAWHEEVLGGLLAGLAAEHGLTADAFAARGLGLRAGAPVPPRIAHWLTDAERAELDAADAAGVVALRVWPRWRSPAWRPAVLDRLRRSDRWSRWCDRIAEADDAVGDHVADRVVVPGPSVCGRLFLRNWPGAGRSPAVEMARRGFLSVEEVGVAAARFFAADVRRMRRRPVSSPRP